MSDAIIFDHVAFSYAGEGAIRDLHATVAAGEIFLVVGPNSSGKSTIARLCVGLERPAAGRIVVNGRIGYIPQGSGLISNRSAWENVLLPLRYLQDYTGGGATETHVDDLFAQFEIAPYRDRLPADLSAGIQKKVAIVRALAMKPEILIADNLTQEVDILEGIRTLQMLRRVSREMALTVLLFAGHLEPESRIADRTAVLSDGVLRTTDGHPWIRAIVEAEQALGKG